MRFLGFITGEQPALVEQAFGDVRQMLEHGHEMFAAATAQLLDNEILDADLLRLDEEINRCEQDLRRAVLEHLNVDPGTELVFSLKLLSIVHEAERIGDLAKTLSRTARLAHRPRLGPLVEPLRSSRDDVLRAFTLLREGFVEGDEVAARRMIRQHERTKDALTRYVEALADDETITPNEGIVYAMAARMMSRVSSHLANVASTVACPFDQIRRSPSWSDHDIPA